MDDSGVVFFAYRCLEKIRILEYCDFSIYRYALNQSPFSSMKLRGGALFVWIFLKECCVTGHLSKVYIIHNCRT